MKRALAIVIMAAACGGSKPPPPASSTGTAGGSGAATVAPTLPPEWAELASGKEYRADLDADGTAEVIAVAGEGDRLTLAIDGAAYACGSSRLTDFANISIVDINPAAPGLEVVVGQHLSDDDWEYCYIYKDGGRLDALNVGNSRVEGTLVLVDGNCSDEPTIYERVAGGFSEREDLVASHELSTRCCEGTDCP